jgi:hypothetical protein
MEHAEIPAKLSIDATAGVYDNAPFDGTVDFAAIAINRYTMFGPPERAYAEIGLKAIAQELKVQTALLKEIRDAVIEK